MDSSPSYGPPANNQVVPYNRLPAPSEILKAMHIFTTKMALTAKQNLVFTDRIDVPPELPASPEYAVYRKYDGYQFTSRDLDLSTNSPFPRRVLINGWIKIWQTTGYGHWVESPILGSLASTP
jgi:hypothetical protein